MNPFFIGPACAIFLVGVREYAQKLVEEHLSGTSKNFLLDCTLAGIFGYSTSQALISQYPIGYTIFFFFLGVTLFTDAWVMLISRNVTLYAIPAAFALSIMRLLPISLNDSIFGAFFGYTLLKIIAHLAKKYYQQEALGQGDIDLLSMIGAFTGWQGCWFTLFIGSIIGSLFGLLWNIKDRFSGLRYLQLPLGTFLAIGAMIYVIFAQHIHNFLLIS